MAKLITAILEWALFLGVSGGLVEATLAMRHEAAQAHAVGLISLGRLNRQLIGGHGSRGTHFRKR